MEYVPPIISNITLEYILPNMPKEDQVEFDTSELSFPKFFVLKRRYKGKKQKARGQGQRDEKKERKVVP